MIELHQGQYSYQVTKVIYNGKEYPAPLDLFPLLAREVLLEWLLERKKSRK
jgi:hypothetical protein